MLKVIDSTIENVIKKFIDLYIKDNLKNRMHLIYLLYILLIYLISYNNKNNINNLY